MSDFPQNGTLNYSYTGEGGTLMFWCNEGLFPSDVRTSVCTRHGLQGLWTPLPQDNCTGIEAMRGNGQLIRLKKELAS